MSEEGNHLMPSPIAMEAANNIANHIEGASFVIPAFTRQMIGREIDRVIQQRVRDLEAAIREHREAYADNRWASGDVSNKLWAALGGAGE